MPLESAKYLAVLLRKNVHNDITIWWEAAKRSHFRVLHQGLYRDGPTQWGRLRPATQQQCYSRCLWRISSFLVNPIPLLSQITRKPPVMQPRVCPFKGSLSTIPMGQLFAPPCDPSRTPWDHLSIYLRPQSPLNTNGPRFLPYLSLKAWFLA